MLYYGLRCLGFVISVNTNQKSSQKVEKDCFGYMWYYIKSVTENFEADIIL